MYNVYVVYFNIYEEENPDRELVIALSEKSAIGFFQEMEGYDPEDMWAETYTDAEQDGFFSQHEVSNIIKDCINLNNIFCPVAQR